MVLAVPTRLYWSGACVLLILFLRSGGNFNAGGDLPGNSGVARDVHLTLDVQFLHAIDSSESGAFTLNLCALAS